MLKDLSFDMGIDKIYEFIKCICLEQEFLRAFPTDYITDIRSKHDRHWKEAIDNICESVLCCIAEHILAEKSLAEPDLEEADYSYIQKVLIQTDLGDIKKRLEHAVEAFVKNHCENDRELLSYLSGAVSGIALRLKSAADNGSLGPEQFPCGWMRPCGDGPQ